MRKTMTMLVGAGFALGLLLGTAPVRAEEKPEGQVLAEKDGCLVCHKVDQKVVGPAYKDIAKKYAGDAKAPEMLAKKVKAGGAGVWGDVPMPPNAAVSEDDIKKIVAWVLSLK